MAMKTGRSEEFAEVVNEIRRLVAIAYPTLGREMRETLALDQFHRVLSADYSGFLVSRPPVDLEEAAQFCEDYKASRNKPSRPRIAVYSTEDEVDMEVNEMRVRHSPRMTGGAEARKGEAMPASENTPISTTEMTQMLKMIEGAFQQGVNKLVSACTEALNQQQGRTGGTNMQSQVRMNERRYATNQRGYQYGQNRMGRRLPVMKGPCHVCNRPHWARECRERQTQHQSQQPTAGDRKPTGNEHGRRLHQ